MRLRNEFDDFISNNAPSARGLSPRRMLNNVTNTQQMTKNLYINPD